MKSVIATLLILIVNYGIAIAQDDDQATDSTRHEELEKVKAAFKETWVHPDADFTQFSNVFLWEGQFQYRDVGGYLTTGILVVVHFRDRIQQGAGHW